MYKKFKLEFHSIENLRFEDDGSQIFNVSFDCYDPELGDGTNDPINISNRTLIRDMTAPADQVLSEAYIQSEVLKRTGYTASL